MITKNDLDTRICDFYGKGDNKETFKEYIRNSEDYFEMCTIDLDNITDEELNEYIGFIDDFWMK